ncbi:MAG: cation:proton antiporter [Candidatus Bilamarchaeaceae archaeon]
MSDILELGIIFFASLAGLLLATRMRLPPAIGILVAGAIIGPYALGMVQEGETINLFSELGAILLLFVIGIEFSLSKIIQSGLRAVLLAFVKFTFLFVVIYEVCLLFGLGMFECIIVASSFAFTSTTLFSKLMKDYESSCKNETHLLIAVLILEDVLAVFVLAVLSMMPVADAVAGSGPGIDYIVLSIVNSLLALVVCYIVLQRAVKLLFDYFAKFKSTETLLFASLSVCALFVFLAGFLGFDASIGAFLAGSLMASLREFKQIEKIMVPFGLFFSSFFFLSMGMMVNPASLMENILLIAVLFVLVSAAKFLVVGAGTFVFGSNIRASMISGLSMLAIGEFSLLIAKKAQPFMSFDLIGVTSALIFLTALAAAVMMRRLDNLNTRVVNMVPPKVRTGGTMVSRYVCKVVSEFEPKGTFFKLFTNETRKMLLYGVALVLLNGAIYLLECAFASLNPFGFSCSPGAPLSIVLHIVISAILILKFLGSFNSVMGGLLDVLRRSDKKNLKLEVKLANDGMWVMALSVLSLAIPVLFSVLKLPRFFDYLAIVPTLLGLLFVWDIIVTIHRIVKSKVRRKERSVFHRNRKHYMFF